MCNCHEMQLALITFISCGCCLHVNKQSLTQAATLKHKLMTCSSCGVEQPPKADMTRKMRPTNVQLDHR